MLKIEIETMHFCPNLGCGLWVCKIKKKPGVRSLVTRDLTPVLIGKGLRHIKSKSRTRINALYINLRLKLTKILPDLEKLSTSTHPSHCI